MFYMLTEYPLLRWSHPTRRELRTSRTTLTHLPTGRRWVFRSKRAAFAARKAMTDALLAGTLTILPPIPVDEPEPVAAA